MAPEAHGAQLLPVPDYGIGSDISIKSLKRKT
jgi:hypothetical protein